MGELFQSIWLILKALFFDWIPAIQSADLGAIGDFKELIGLVASGAAILGFLIHKLKKYT